MENLKRKRIEASILLEALVALAVFAMIASLLLGQIRQARQDQQQVLAEEEILRVARMALQTGQDEVTMNGITVRQLKKDGELVLYHQGKELLRVQKK